MKTSVPTGKRGFALKDLLIVIFLFCSLVSLAMAWRQYFGSRKRIPECMTKAINIASAIKNYSEIWEGWTNPDAHYFVKEFGYKLNSEPGYFGEPPPWYLLNAKNPTESQKHAATIQDFRCLDDDSPKITKHGILTSYQVTPAFAGQSLWDRSKPADKVLAVFEMGKRHRGTRLGDKFERYYIYGDLHGELGGEVQDSNK